MGHQLVNALKEPLAKCLEQAQHQAQLLAGQVIVERTKQMQILLGDELARLVSLRQVNPAIRDEEIYYIENQIKQLQQVIGEARLSLEAVRLVVNNPK
jgi:ATP-dependent helicase HepA